MFGRKLLVFFCAQHRVLDSDFNVVRSTDADDRAAFDMQPIYIMHNAGPAGAHKRVGNIVPQRLLNLHARTRLQYLPTCYTAGI